MQSFNKFKLVTVVVASLAVAAFAGQVNLTGGFVGCGPDYVGNLTGFGHFTGHFYGSVQTEVLVASNGDRLYAHTSNFVRGATVDGVTAYSEHWHFVAGTGRFANATGDATVSGDGYSNGVYEGDIVGSVLVPARAP